MRRLLFLGTVLILAACSANEPTVPMSAVIERRIPGFVLSPAPSGDTAIVWTDDDGACIVDIASADRVNCPDDEFLQVAGTFAWSPDNAEVAFSPSVDSDIRVLDVRTGRVENLTDDGAIDPGEATPIDRGPVWSDDGAGIMFYRSAGGGPLSLTMIDRSGTEKLSVPLPQRENGRPRVLPIGPILAIEGDRVWLPGVGEIFEVALDEGTVTQAVDYADQYAPVLPGRERVAAQLQPIGYLGEGQLLLIDPETTTSAINQGIYSGASSGAYLIDLADGSLTPLFATSSLEGGWLGPTRVAVSPSGEVLLVMWIDAAAVSVEPGAPVVVISVLDLRTAELPEDPRRLPEVWRGEDEAILFFDPAGIGPWIWTDDDTVAVVSLTGQDTLILRLS